MIKPTLSEIRFCSHHHSFSDDDSDVGGASSPVAPANAVASTVDDNDAPPELPRLEPTGPRLLSQPVNPALMSHAQYSPSILADSKSETSGDSEADSIVTIASDIEKQMDETPRALAKRAAGYSASRLVNVPPPSSPAGEKAGIDGEEEKQDLEPDLHPAGRLSPSTVRGVASESGISSGVRSRPLHIPSHPAFIPYLPSTPPRRTPSASEDSDSPAEKVDDDRRANIRAGERTEEEARVQPFVPDGLKPKPLSVGRFFKTGSLKLPQLHQEVKTYLLKEWYTEGLPKGGKREQAVKASLGANLRDRLTENVPSFANVSDKEKEKAMAYARKKLKKNRISGAAGQFDPVFNTRGTTLSGKELIYKGNDGIYIVDKDKPLGFGMSATVYRASKYDAAGEKDLAAKQHLFARDREKEEVAMKLLKGQSHYIAEFDNAAVVQKPIKARKSTKARRVDGYLFMELASSNSLQKILPKIGRLPADQREKVKRTLARDMIMAVKDLHAQGVYNGDIKPENAHLGRDGRLKVIDQGMATTQAQVANNGSFGTPAYQPPERGGSMEKFDIFSLGGVLRALSNGRETITPSTKKEPGELSSLQALSLAARQADPQRRPSAEALLDSSYIKGDVYEPEQLIDELYKAGIIKKKDYNLS